MKPVINLASGLSFDFSDPRPEAISVRDIAHHLSRLNRWAGNIEWVRFCVAQHSLIVCQACTIPSARPYALLHDAPEMIVGDNITPLKKHLLSLGVDMPAYEDQILRQAIYPAFGLPYPSAEIQADVHRADAIAMATELRDVVANKTGIIPTQKPLSGRIKFMTQPMAEEKFLNALRDALRPYGKIAA
jgi:5'-deoxynucleotidase YfbR-like HD superfamily hydrolase